MYSRSIRVGLTLSALLGLSLTSFAQRPPQQPNAAEILHKMQKLNVLGSVLYIAAHPDDENTRLITWLANGKKVRTGYLSLTRGEGGQNLIGPELGDALGIIRTQELLEARRIDGGEQFFTRAVDFGYSKSAEESFQKWGKQEVLSDVVRVIRMFRPDVIITRFNTDGSGGHGHHTASAILAAEAFDLAGDPKAFPEQLEQGLEVWQPRRLFFNASTWWRKDVAELAKTDPTWFTVDVGGYDPLLGLSYTEIAGRSRSMHKSQGFGAAETRGEMLEYLHLEKGDRPKTKDIFEGIDFTWAAIPGGKVLEQRIRLILDSFDARHPEKSIPELAALRTTANQSEPEHITKVELALQVEFIIALCAGIAVPVDLPFTTVPLCDTVARGILRAVVRNYPQARFTGYGGSWGYDVGWDYRVNLPLIQNQVLTDTLNLPIVPGAVDEPYWLTTPHSSLYGIGDPYLIGHPVAPLRPFLRPYIEIQLSDSIPALFESDVMYKWVDRVAGERIRPVYVTPVASVIPKNDVFIAGDGPQEVIVEVEALTDGLTGQLNVTLPEGWSTTKDIKLVEIAKRNERQSFTFRLVPTENAKQGAARFEFTGPKGKADRTLHEIDYPHIMPQVYYTPAEVKLIPLDVKTTAKTVGYIKGAGDEVPEAIEQLGVKVDIVDPATATLESLRKYDAIVTGIRAYNTVAAMKTFNPTLMQYVAEGGTLVSQYNTLSRDMMVPDSLFGPYPFKLTRDRVTEENASCTFLTADHPLMKSPNVITANDFEGWVQERGLYFSGELDPRYTPLLSWNDEGEGPLSGGLITCDYGKGRYIYTGISFFRQLPAGVPGAYRLFANLISRREAE